MAELLRRHLIFTSYDDLIEPKPEKPAKREPWDCPDRVCYECNSCAKQALVNEDFLCKLCYEEGY